MIPAPEPWHHQARCALEGQDVNLFFPERNSGRRDVEPGAIASEARPLRVCSRCTVRSECLRSTLEFEREGVDPLSGRRTRSFPTGIAGGTTERMRRDPHLNGLSIDDKHAVLDAWFRSRVVPVILAPGEEVA